MLLLALIAWMAASPEAVHACSVGSFGSPERQIEKLLELIEGSDAVFVGTVVDEQRVGKVAENEIYVSNVKLEAVLSGEIEGASIAVRALAFDDTFCEGGPRLREGERVLLALDWKSTGSVLDGEDPYAWMLHGILGKVRLDDDQAVSQYADLGLTIGSPEEIIGQVGRALDSEPNQIEAAVAAAAMPVRASNGSAFPLQAAVAGAILIGVALVVWVRWRRGPAKAEDDGSSGE